MFDFTGLVETFRLRRVKEIHELHTTDRTGSTTPRAYVPVDADGRHIGIALTPETMIELQQKKIVSYEACYIYGGYRYRVIDPSDRR